MRITSVLLLIGCCLSAASAQWLEAMISLPADSAPSDICYSSHDHKLYVAFGGRYPDVDSVVFVLDAGLDTVMHTLYVGAEPVSLCCDQTDGKVYVACVWAGRVDVIDGSSDTVIARIPMPSSPWRLFWEARRNRVYCAGAGNFLEVIDCATDSVIASEHTGDSPYALCYNSRNDHLYVANLQDSTVTVLDCSTNVTLPTIQVGREPCALCVNTADDKVYCANSGGNTVTVIDATADTVLADVRVGSFPMALCWNPVDDKVYSANGNSGTVSIISGGSNQVIATVPTGIGPSDVYYNSLNNRVYAADFGNSVSVIHGNWDSVVATIAVDNTPIQFAWNPVENRTYASSYFQPRLAVIRDSMTSIEEAPDAEVQRRSGGATVRHRLPTGAVVFDAMGRRVVNQKPGVYFVRGQDPRGQGIEDSRVRKVVVAR